MAGPTTDTRRFRRLLRWLGQSGWALVRWWARITWRTVKLAVFVALVLTTFGAIYNTSLGLELSGRR